MAKQYIKFDGDDLGTVLIEVEPGEVSRPDGPVKAGLQDKVKDAVAVASTSLEEAVIRVVRTNARLFVAAINGLERQPTEMEVSFGVKATGELGNLAIAKTAAEANYSVRLLWTRD